MDIFLLGLVGIQRVHFLDGFEIGLEEGVQLVYELGEINTALSIPPHHLLNQI